MKRLLSLLLLTASTLLVTAKPEAPWKNGALRVSDNNRYLVHENGKPFFWLGDTGWLMPERLNRDEVDFYLSRCAQAGYNVVQVQTVNAVPAYNAYGQSSHPAGYDFSDIDRPGVYGYWDHMDYIVQTAERHGIYIGMVCIWGGLVKSGKMTQEEAVKYGTFLANRYKDCPNIVWIIGGDIQGSVKTEVWETLARTIRAIDTAHLMTFHPRGRTCSSQFFPAAEWIDFHMFQSGHRRYDQLVVAASDKRQAESEALPVVRVLQEQLPAAGTIVPADSAWVVKKYDRLAATRGDDYLLVYNYTGRPMQIDLTKIAGKRKKAWWYSPVTGEYAYIGEYRNRTTEFVPPVSGVGSDIVLVVTDAAASYLQPLTHIEGTEQRSFEE